MKKNTLLLAAAAGFMLASCGKSVKKTPGGIEYTVFKAGNGPQLKVGDTAMMNITQRLNDSVLADSRKIIGAPVPVLVQKSSEKYDLMEGIALLKVGDSARFTIPWDSLPEFQRPPFGKKGDKINITFAVAGLYSQSAQRTADEKAIQDYISANKLETTKTPEGVYVAVTEHGTGEAPKTGDTVYVHYTGKLLNGKVFDSSLDSTLRPGMPINPIKFPLGQGFVIKGWDAGLATLKKGDKATLVIPSTLAYGLQGSPPAIPSNSVLVFTVQLVDVKAGKPAPAAPPVAPPVKK